MKIDEEECLRSLDVDLNFECECQFVGQLLVVVNVNLSYINLIRGWDVILVFNYFVDCLEIVGVVGMLDIFEVGCGQLDFFISKKLNGFKIIFWV